MTLTTFRYQALDPAGARRFGLVTAATPEEVFRRVTQQGMTPLRIRAADPKSVARRGRTISPGELGHFTYQLGVLIGARLPIADSLLSIAQQERNVALRDVITDVASRIESGESVAASLAAHRTVFGDVYVETVYAAERSGNLVKVLEELSSMIERAAESRRQVRSALMYPLCVVGVLAIAVIFLLGFVIPKYAEMFEERGVPLPLLTRVLMQIGRSFQHYWWVYLILCAIAVLVFRGGRYSSGLRRVVDLALHRLPYLGDVLTGLATARFTRILATCLGSGLRLIESLEMSGKSAGRVRLKQDVEVLVEQVRKGGRLRDALSMCSYLPPFAKRMISAGEESGELPRMCAVVSRHYDRESAYLTKNLTTVIEPLLVVLIAAVVLVVALAIFLPMWNMVSLVG